MRLDQSRAAADEAREPASPQVAPTLPMAQESVPKRVRPQLRTYLIAIVLFALTPALLLGAATVWQLGAAYRGSAELGLTGTARALTTALDRELEAAAEALDTLAASPPLATGDLDAAYPQAAAVGRAFGGWVSLLDAGMRQRFHTLIPPRQDLPAGAGAVFVSRALEAGQTVVSDLFKGATVRRPVIAVFRPLPPGVAGAAPGERRVLLLAFGPERLSALLARRQVAQPGGFAVLTDGAGRVVARSAEHGHFLGRPAPAWYVEGVRGRDGGLLQGTSLAGFDAVVAFQRLEQAPGWTLAVTLPLATHEVEWRNPAFRFALGAALTIGLGAALATLLARRLFRPLRTLAGDAEQLGASGAEARAPSEEDGVAEVETIRCALRRSGAALRANALAEGRAAAAEETAGKLREAARRRDLLIAELNHRVKNTLATVQSLAAQSLKGVGGNPARFAEEFPARLRTLARAHDLLSRNDWQPADFGEVVRAALAPWLGAEAGERVRISDGLSFAVSPAQAQALVLALHELATNAVKHGALSVPGGYVHLRHARAADDIAIVEWVESGGPPIRPAPARRGFGTRLLEQGLARDLGPGATVELHFEPVGLRAAIRFVPAGR
ncbi:sensor histidine kinase [Belnapia sp. T6]|uniref:histidine kinase n=1 Tax=Belnapia mucosa TaxID=2804532 RepID=A0ABS1VD25_9PROT|nr:sensor histidine kinase [Belnapia mucosa]MBL6459006.1 sensor histidine kinase [Belnapia mucosa]